MRILMNHKWFLMAANYYFPYHRLSKHFDKCCWLNFMHNQNWVMRIFLPKETTYRDIEFLARSSTVVGCHVFGIYQDIFHLINVASNLRTLTCPHWVQFDEFLNICCIGLYKKICCFIAENIPHSFTRDVLFCKILFQLSWQLRYSESRFHL